MEKDKKEIFFFSLEFNLIYLYRDKISQNYIAYRSEYRENIKIIFSFL